MKRSSILKAICLAVLGAGSVLQSFQAHATYGFEVVHFSAISAPKSKTSEPTEKAKIWGHLKLPDGDGPYPAIILMHGCGGIRQSHFNWADVLVKTGYAVLIVDSFRPRSIVRQCGSGVSAASPSGRVLDAYGALQFLSGLPSIDTKRIGLIGWSHGAIAAMTAVTENGIGQRYPQSFSAVAALYPYCFPGRKYFRPVSILIGEADDWTPAQSCRELVDGLKDNPHPLDLTVLPGATHAFDDPDTGEGVSVPGDHGKMHWLKYDAEGHQTAIEKIKAFFAKSD